MGVIKDVEFDSSPKYTLSKILGTDPTRFELKLLKDDGKHEFYEVYSGQAVSEGDTESPMLLRGHLNYEKPATRYARLRRGASR
jgi:hypothetical protein